MSKSFSYFIFNYHEMNTTFFLLINDIAINDKKNKIINMQCVSPLNVNLYQVLHTKHITVS